MTPLFNVTITTNVLKILVTQVVDANIRPSVVKIMINVQLMAVILVSVVLMKR
jgi:hypothetical protein